MRKNRAIDLVDKYATWHKARGQKWIRIIHGTDILASGTREGLILQLMGKRRPRRNDRGQT